jgi:hypothetical protein
MLTYHKRIVTVHEIILGYQLKEDWMGGINGRSLRPRLVETMLDLAKVGGEVILNEITRRCRVRVPTLLEWLRVSSDSAFLCAQHNLLVPCKCGLFTEHLREYSQEGHCFTKLYLVGTAPDNPGD